MRQELARSDGTVQEADTDALLEGRLGAVPIDVSLIEEMWLEALGKRGSATLLIVGDSMQPFILRGDRVVVSAVQEAASVSGGDVVLLRIENALVVHRILRRFRHRGRLCFRQKGDAALQSSVVDADAVLGKVIGIERDGGIRTLDGLSWTYYRPLLWVTVWTTDLLYRFGRLIKQGLGTLPQGRVTRFSASIKTLMRQTQERFVRELSSKARST